MESSFKNLISIQSLVSEVKKEILCSGDYDNMVHIFVSHCSAYDMAWMAKIPHQENGNSPKIENCLNWIVKGQKEGRFYGETEQDGNLLSIDALPATLACFVALKTWNASQNHNSIEKVPSKYPIDGDLVKLCIVDHLQGLGLAEHFGEDIQKILAQVYSNQRDYNNPERTETDIVRKLFKDALSFRLMRMQGYSVTPGSFCWFLHEPEIMAYIEQNSERFTSAMYNVYRATDLPFPREAEMEEARIFARKLLENISTTYGNPNLFCSKGLQNMIKYELNVPWTARLNHLYHRKWIEESITGPLCFGMPSFYGLSGPMNKKLLQIAVENYEFRQMIYRRELEELKGWSKKLRLSEMGFGREKTVYSYFVTAASSCFPLNSIMRSVAAKAAIIVTVADDFYDMEGSLTQLEALTDAIRRWDSRGLEGHGKTIFDALDDFVNETVACFCGPQERTKVVTKLRYLWIETFESWMVERRWSLTGYKPSMEEYLLTGMISIAAHTIALPTTDFLTENTTNKSPDSKLEYHGITKLLMSISRLANDTQSYEKEKLDGKLNYVLLHSYKNPSTSVADSVAYVRGIIQDMRKEFVEHVYMDGDVNESFRHIHLSIMKVFQMFFESANLFDSETALVDEIQRALYVPIVHKPKPEPLLRPSVPLTSANNVKNVKKKKNKDVTEILARFRPVTRPSGNIGFIRPLFVKNSTSYVGRERMNVNAPMQFNLCFI
ncbi:terpene synthase [Striga asiatica]|uniref:Terpene synthase n=1 Tax=Striga asiatica TaxID=4170 RepID=A0A5A7PUG7_STRAF|nr:terpene synthase [Striga asiatica]